MSLMLMGTASESHIYGTLARLPPHAECCNRSLLALARSIEGHLSAPPGCAGCVRHSLARWPTVCALWHTPDRPA